MDEGCRRVLRGFSSTTGLLVVGCCPLAAGHWNQIKIASSLGLTTFGNIGVDTETNGTWSGKARIFNFRFPREPHLILGLIAEGSLQYSVKYATDSKDSLQISLSGDLKASVEVVSWPAGYTTMSA